MSKQSAKTLMPELRFPEFRDTSGWKTKKLGEVFEFHSTANNSRADLSDSGDTLYVHYGDIHKNFHRYIDLQKDVTPKISNHLYRNATPLKIGDLIIADASEDTDGIAKSIEVLGLSTEYKAIAGLHTLLLRDSEKVYANGFRGLLQDVDDVKRQVRRLAVGTKVYSVSKTVLRQVDLPVPPISEQKKITNCLLSLDELISLQSKKIEALITHKKGLMQKLFPAEGETVPYLRFPEFLNVGDWKEKRLGDISEVLQGYGFPERLQGEVHGRYPFCKVSDISRAVADNGGFLEFAINYISDEILHELRAKLIPEGTTVFAKIGEALRLNRRAITKKECLIDNNAAGLKAKKQLAVDYFIYQLMQKIDLGAHSGGVVPSINKTTLENILVIVPSINEQQKIAECLSSIDELIYGQTQKLKSLKTHKKGLMQKLFPTIEESNA